MADDLDRSPALTGRSLQAATGPVPTGGTYEDQVILEIAEALTEIRDLHSEAVRSFLVDATGRALGRPLNVLAVPDPRLFAYFLVASCHAEPHGLQALARSIEFLAGGHTPVVARIRRLASPAEELLVPSAEARARELLEGLAPPSLVRLYYAAAGGVAAPAPGALNDAWDAFAILLDANAGPDLVPRTLVFVESLIQWMRKRTAAGLASALERSRLDGLREWMDEQRAVLRETTGPAVLEHLDRIGDRPELRVGGSDTPIYLVIQLEPLPETEHGQPLYRLSHWKQLHPFEWRPEPGEDRFVPENRLAEAVADLIQDAEDGWAYALDDSLALEFVLPFELLDLALDQWTRDPPGSRFPTPLGSEYQIVVRSHERLYARGTHRAWRQRWRVLVEAGRCATWWAEPGMTHDPEWLRDTLLGRTEVVACVLTTPPGREPGRSELEVALRAGLPAVAWLRESEETETETETEEKEDPRSAVRQALLDVAGGPDLRELPADIKTLRMRPIVAADQSGTNRPQITLIWDDPNRLLEDISPLRTPEPKRHRVRDNRQG